MDKKTLRAAIDSALANGRRALNAPEAQQFCEAYGIPTPQQSIAKTAGEAAKISSRLGFPVVLKIVSDDILHKTEAGGVIVGLEDAAGVRRAFEQLVKNAQAYRKNAAIQGVQVQQMLNGGQELMVGAVTDPSFGKMIGFGIGGVLVEVMKDITFRMAPVGKKEALSMLDSIGAAEVLRGVRGQKGVNRVAVADIIGKVSKLVSDFPEMLEVDLNPIFATDKDAQAVDVRIVLGDKPQPRPRYEQAEILAAMQRIMNPRSLAVIGASAEDGKIGNSVMKNLINGGYRGAIYPIHPKAPEIMGRKAYPSVLEIGDDIDVAVFAIPARLCAAAMEEVGRKKIPGAVMIPSGFAEVGEQTLQDELLAVARRHNVRVMGPNIYGFYYTPQNLCATFCTPYDVKGKVALSSQSGGVGMSIIGFSRTTRMGVSAIVGLGNKSDLDEDDLLTYFEQDDHTQVIAMHCEDLKDGRSFAEVASRVSKKKPI
ncbi:MAG TPA: acetate--CoA ligase family protein, partial [Candidatus Binatia bacterium]|nr:acetate--CoA ligase family protein [Candidatus Binatia bacterium]